MTAEERELADESFPLWLAATYPDESLDSMSPSVIAERLAAYRKEIETLFAVEI